VAKLVPVQGEAIDLYGYMAETAQIRGDIVEPIDAESEANAENT
jgi:hypothetical protein